MQFSPSKANEASDRYIAKSCYSVFFFYNTNRYKQILCDPSIFDNIDDLAFEISPDEHMQKPDKLVKAHECPSWIKAKIGSIP